MTNSEDFRRVIEVHHVEMLHDADDTFVRIPLRAVVREGAGVVEIGSHSITSGDAWMLAQSLLMLAKLADPNYQTEPVADPVEFMRQLRACRDSEDT